MYDIDRRNIHQHGNARVYMTAFDLQAHPLNTCRVPPEVSGRLKAQIVMGIITYRFAARAQVRYARMMSRQVME